MTFNFSKVGYPIATVKGGKYANDKIFLSDTQNDKIKTFDKLELTDGMFQQVPNTKKERDVGMICGASGSGKSTYCKNYIIEYNKAYKNRPVYLLSNLDKDETLDSLKIISRIKIDEQLLKDPLTVKDFKDCLVIFDDVEIIPNKFIKRAVYQLLDEIIMTGRHFNISCLMVSHAGTGNEVKRILQECHFFVYFPWGQNLKYTLEKYLGLDNKQIRQIKATKSRWACVFKNYPQAVLTEKHLFLLSID
jgi:energy-coupling factor transporter ATP-binding protein EcfA2